MTPEQLKALRTAEANLTAVLCDPNGKCCISGSVADLRIIDDALDIIRTLAQLKPTGPSAEPVRWIDSNGHPHHISAIQGVREKQLYGPWEPVFKHPKEPT
jgi:hypothetical protein